MVLWFSPALVNVTSSKMNKYVSCIDSQYYEIMEYCLHG